MIKDHRFTPAEVKAPAGQKIRLVIENQDPTPEEFESYALNREKIVPGGGQLYNLTRHESAVAAPFSSVASRPHMAAQLRQ